MNLEAPDCSRVLIPTYRPKTRHCNSDDVNGKNSVLKIIFGRKRDSGRRAEKITQVGASYSVLLKEYRRTRL
jgi:hypothetical protein